MPFKNFQSISTCEQFTEKKIAVIRDKLKALCDKKGADKFCIVATGSYGRFEASSESDIDLFVVSDDDIEDEVLDNLKSDIEQIISSEIPKPPGDTNTFGFDICIKINRLVTNIGGNRDSNASLTNKDMLCERSEPQHIRLLDKPTGLQ